MSQVARNLSDAAEGSLAGKRYLIHARDPDWAENSLRGVIAVAANGLFRRGGGHELPGVDPIGTCRTRDRQNR
jgi:hypothetical protein